MLPDEPWRYHTFWRRFWAGWIDLLVCTPVMWASHLLLESNLKGLAAVALSTLVGSVGVAYSVVGHAVFGQTLGKRACRVQVLDLDGNLPGFRRALLRDCFGVLFVLVDAAREFRHFVLEGGTMATFAKEVPDARYLYVFMYAANLWILLEFVTMLTNPRRRAVHDFLAGTVVVRGQWASRQDGPTSPSD